MSLFRKVCLCANFLVSQDVLTRVLVRNTCYLQFSIGVNGFNKEIQMRISWIHFYRWIGKSEKGFAKLLS